MENKEQARLDESKRIIAEFESVEMAEYEYFVSASYDDPYWQRVKQAIKDCEVKDGD